MQAAMKRERDHANQQMQASEAAKAKTVKAAPTEQPK
jgi:hypothetical protein